MRLIFLFLLNLTCFAMASASIEADLHVYKFQQEQGNYIEVYSRISAESLTWQEVNGQSHAAVDLLLLLREVEGDTIHAQKLVLKANHLSSKDLMDVRRIRLDPGTYEVILDLTDQLNTVSTQQIIYAFEIREDLGVQQSSLILNVDNQRCLDQKINCRSGLSVEPLPWDISGEDNKVIYLYNELMNTDWLGGPFFIAYGLRNLEGEDIAIRYKRLDPQKQIVLNLPFDVSKLVSEEYRFFIDVFNQGKTKMSGVSAPFTKVNPSADLEAITSYNDKVSTSWVQQIPEEDLVFDLKSIWPLVANHRTATLDRITRSEKPRLQRHFIYTFWKERGGENPEAAYYQYREVAKAVDKRFYNSVGFGTETDRGYIYLKYGKPNDIIAVEDEPEAPPYQIWRYNYIPNTKQNNVKFIFYNPSLASNDFQLLHGTCRGELQNPAWEVELYRRAPWDQQGASVQATTVSDNYNRQARRIFEDL
jgi:GWxTD domain-containing protein